MKQSNISWQSVKTLFRLDLRSRKDATHELKKKDKAMKVMNFIFGLVLYAMLVAGIYFFTNMFVKRAGLSLGDFLSLLGAYRCCGLGCGRRIVARGRFDGIRFHDIQSDHIQISALVGLHGSQSLDGVGNLAAGLGTDDRLDFTHGRGEHDDIAGVIHIDDSHCCRIIFK